MAKDTSKLLRDSTRQIRGVMAFLVLEFVLGITLTTIINYNPNNHSAVQTGFVIAHIIVGVGLLAGAIARLAVSLRTKFLQIPSIIGFGSVIAAFAAGVVAANSGSGVAVFLMALFFLVAFISYGYSLGKVMSVTTC